MEYQVQVSEHAEAEIDAVVEWIGRNSPAAAARWLIGLKEAVESLSTYPSRCGRAREQEFDTQDIRQLVYRNYFVIEAEPVRVLHVRHAARQTMWPSKRNESDDNAD